MATSRGSAQSKKKEQAKGSASELMSPKNIGIAAAAVLMLGLSAYLLANHFGVIGGEKPSTDPAVIDPTSTYTEAEKKEYQKIQEQQKAEAEKPNALPPSGS